MDDVWIVSVTYPDGHTDDVCFRYWLSAKLFQWSVNLVDGWLAFWRSLRRTHE